jgi:ribokinase
MKPTVLNVGSLNIDRVFRVPHIARPGETLASRSVEVFAGGKGANQSVALARAGMAVRHCGKVGADGRWLIDLLAAEGVDSRFVTRSDRPTGQAIIQVADDGQNAIVLLAGANHDLSTADIEAALSDSPGGTWVLTQNETSRVGEVIELAAAKGFPVAFNPAPLTPEVTNYPIEAVALLIVNEVEGVGLARRTTVNDILTSLRSRLPATELVLTLGASGVVYDGREGRVQVPTCQVEAVDTTAAGDTFIGYFLASRLNGAGVRESLETACRAAAICVCRPGAIESIPGRMELESMSPAGKSNTVGEADHR